MQTKQNSSEKPSALSALIEQNQSEGDSPFQFNPITLMSMLDKKQHFDIAAQAFLQSQLLFNAGRLKDYENFLIPVFKAAFASDAFLSLHADTQAMHSNMAMQLLTLLSEMKDLDKKINNKIVKAAQKQYRKSQS
ncbi:hypothetical protein [Runella salmonicolor]|uniref:Uncharacterized protein n=1 Tax=Runella salmonicolor TaxID=2950278 RepID=A0ABT1FSY7_9BACT|nr:hypothetical protein [Runella salmonicolor]MCP1384817.1 hypothetical protein [Runella salmonicolor]